MRRAIISAAVTGRTTLRKRRLLRRSGTPQAIMIKRPVRGT
jgi:hypothetical protein